MSLAFVFQHALQPYSTRGAASSLPVTLPLSYMISTSLSLSIPTCHQEALLLLPFSAAVRAGPTVLYVCTCVC